MIFAEEILKANGYRKIDSMSLEVFLDPDGLDRCAYIDCNGKAIAHVFSDNISERNRNAKLLANAPALFSFLQEHHDKLPDDTKAKAKDLLEYIVSPLSP